MVEATHSRRSLPVTGDSSLQLRAVADSCERLRCVAVPDPLHDHPRVIAARAVNSYRSVSCSFRIFFWYMDETLVDSGTVWVEWCVCSNQAACFSLSSIAACSNTARQQTSVSLSRASSPFTLSVSHAPACALSQRVRQSARSAAERHAVVLLHLRNCGCVTRRCALLLREELSD